MKNILKIFFGIMIIATAMPTFGAIPESIIKTIKINNGNAQANIDFLYYVDNVPHVVKTDEHGRIKIPDDETKTIEASTEGVDIFTGTAKIRGRTVPNAIVTYYVTYEDTTKAFQTTADNGGVFRVAGLAKNYGIDDEFGVLDVNSFNSEKSKIITGTVVNQKGEPLLGAAIQLTANKSHGVTAGKGGQFTLDNIPIGDNSITVSHVGYTPQTISVNNDKKVQSIEIKLTEEPISLNEVTATASDLTGKICATVTLQKVSFATTGVYEKKQIGGGYDCVPTACVAGYEVKQKQCVEISGPCQIPPPNAASSQRRYDTSSGEEKCIITACNDGFDLDTEKNTCNKIQGPCTPGQLPENATAGNRVFQDNKEICIPTACDTSNGYEFDKAKKECIPISGNCKPDMAGATAGKRKFDSETGNEICVPTKCDDGFALVGDKCEPKLSAADSAARVDELRDNAQAMRDKEQSTANKALGAASIGATGIGAAQFLGATAEQSADDAAERDMRAYLATFRCDYGGGMNITGGDTGIMLPGGNELFTLYNEYKDLATNLKTTKESLGLLPGIESETVFDKASTGLYDNAAVGRTGGAYTSLSSALSDPAGADAAAWAAQRAASASAAQTGAIIAGAGIVAGVAGNIALNTGKNAPKENSATINAKYASLMNAAENLKNTIMAETPQPEEKSGEESDSTPLSSDAQQKCNGTWTGDRCDCGTGAKGSYYYDDKDLICRCSDVNSTYPNCKESLVTVEQINVLEEMKKIKAGQPVNATTIINKTLCDVVREGCENGKVTMKGVNFEFNKFTVLQKGIDTLKQTAQAIKNIQNNKELKDVSIIISITGHTDNIGSDTVNNQLSQQRADEAKKHLVSEGISANIITTAGLGKKQPIADNKTREGRANNRRVEIQVLAGQNNNTQSAGGRSPTVIPTGSTGSATAATNETPGAAFQKLCTEMKGRYEGEYEETEYIRYNCNFPSRNYADRLNFGDKCAEMATQISDAQFGYEWVEPDEDRDAKQAGKFLERCILVLRKTGEGTIEAVLGNSPMRVVPN